MKSRFQFCLVAAALTVLVQSEFVLAEQPTDHQAARTEIASFFQAYQQATADETAEKVTELYDFETMTDEIIAQAGVEIPDRLRQVMASALKQQVGQQLKLFGRPWYRHKVVSIKFFGGEDQAEVFVRGWNENQETSRDIFWLHRKNKAWRIFDFMDLSMGLTCTKLGALGMQQGMLGRVSAESMEALRSLLSAVMLVGQDDLDGATEAMARVLGKPVPKFVDSVRWFFDAAISMTKDATLTLEHLDKATAFQPDLPMAAYMRSVAYNLLDRHELAAASARRFIDRFGDDADAYQELAIALEALGKREEAVVELRKALADTPNSLANVETIGLLLPKNGKHELAEYFQNLRDHSDSFQYLADAFEMEEDGEALNVLVKSMEKIDAGEPLLDYYKAVVMSTRGQHDRALDHLREVLKRIDEADDDRGLYEHLCLAQAINADKLLDLYQSAEDPKSFASEAFDAVVDREQFLRGTAMLDAHVKAFPDDPSAHLMAGDLDFYQNEFEAADQHFARGLAVKPEDDDIKYELIYSRALAWHNRGKTLEAYRELEPKARMFEELSGILRDNEDDETLEKLIELRRKDVPESLSAARMSAALLFDREDYDGVIKLLSKANQGLAQRPKTEADEDDIGYRLDTDELLIRSLIRVKQWDNAMPVAKAALGEEESAFYQALLHAVRGDRDAFDAAYKSCRDEFGYDEYDFIYDDDFPDGFAGLSESRKQGSSQLRSLAVLLSSPQQIDPQLIIVAAGDAWDTRLFEEDYQQVDVGDDHFVCQLTENACVLSADGFRVFVRTETGPFLGDAKLLAEESDADLAELILAHQAWLHVDVDVWPTAESDNVEEASVAIPRRAQQLVGSLAIKLSGENGTIVVDRDSGEMRKLTPELAKTIEGENPVMALMDLER